MPDLRSLVADELSLPVDERVRQIAEAIASQHGSASRAVLFYGSCLREQKLDGQMLDFYLIVSSYREAYSKRWLAIANRLLPPNVFYFECAGLVCKYAVLSQYDFKRLNSPGSLTVSVWARFAQPSRLAWARNDAARQMIFDAITHAAPTLLAGAGRREGETVLDWWERAFALTYSAELRAEPKNRPTHLVGLDRPRYQRFGEAAIAELAKTRFREGSWARRRVVGKLVSIARLAKASMTFAGGADYIAWKINRHSGTVIRLKPWQRRHPLLAGVSLLPRLLKSGSVR